MELKISQLQANEKEIISFIEDKLSFRWRMKRGDIQNKWIKPALHNRNFPYIFIAKIGDKFAGKIFLFIEPNGYLGINNQPWITALFVDKSFRRKHIGEKLIQKAKAKARKKGYNEIFLDTASSSGYYDKIGGWETLGTALWEAWNQDVVIMKSSVYQ
jgi:GNAT superfamily N-acetyltransferase